MGLIGKPKFVKKIAELGVGERGYTFPGALSFNNANTPFLYTDASVVEAKTPKMNLLVIRTGLGEDDYDVMIPANLQFSWVPSDTFFEKYQGADTSQFAQLQYDGENLAEAQKRKREAREEETRKQQEISDLEKALQL
ncbi:hypothetical protein HZA97_04175 [Candidatus Woesearchaeota archaeon]|nr:hypothetical protein [Candidatus Woesearchaeota archaeon]